MVSHRKLVLEAHVGFARVDRTVEGAVILDAVVDWALDSIGCSHTGSGLKSAARQSLPCKQLSIP